MRQKDKKLLLVALEVVLLIIVVPILFAGAYFLLLEIARHYGLPEIPYWLAPLVLCFDVLWIVLILLSSWINIHVRVILTILVFTLSASVLFWLFAMWVLSGVF